MLAIHHLFGKQAESGKLLQANFTDLELLKKYCHDFNKTRMKSLPKPVVLVMSLCFLIMMGMDVAFFLMLINTPSLYYFIAESFFLVSWTALCGYLLWIGIARKLVTRKYNLEF